MTTTRIRRCGEAALLLECADLAEAVALARRVEQLRLDALDVVAAARTVLVTTRDAASLPGLRRRLEALLAERSFHPQDPLASGELGHHVGDSGCGSGAPESVTLDVRYDGPDLADVSELAGLSARELVRWHTSITWSAAFGGFAPGFFYLVDERELLGPDSDDPAKSSGAGADDAAAGDGGLPPESLPPVPLPPVPRLASPRARVPAGSVGLADRFCAVYPGASPGGWRLLGTTDARLWDSDRPAPALLAPGMRVRFRDVTP